MGGLCPVLQYTSDHRKVGSIKDGLHGQPQIALWLTNQRMIRRIRHVCGWRMCSRKEHGAHKLDLARRVVSNVVSLQFRKGLTAMAGNAGSIAHSRAECSLGAQRMVCRRAAAHRGSPVICRATVKDAGSASKAHEAEKRKLTGTFDILAEDLQYIQQATGLDLTTSFSSVKEAHEQVVSLLNPIIGEKVEQEIEEQILNLQASLQQAHQQVHASEALLNSTVSQLSELEASASSIRFASEGAEQPQQPSASTSSSSTSVAPVQAATQTQATSPLPTDQALQRRYSSQTKRRRLHSSLALPATLHQFWYPAEFSSQLKKRSIIPLELFHEPWVLFRGADGKAACIRDTCAHQTCPLSLGHVVNEQVQCPYHGWRYNGEGVCTSMPSTAHVPGIAIDSLLVAEADGFVWVWMGSGPPPALPEVAKPPAGFQVHAELQLEVPVDHGLLLENLLDLAHAPFTHTTTFAKGWPVPEVVKFKAAQLLGGNWEPYPIDMSFEPPCMVLSTIGLAQPGKIVRGARAASCRNHLHQLHVCLPAGPGRTRLLYRMSMDFLGWSRHVPFIQKFWSQIAGQVLGEDLVLVAGQQDRLQRGADVWSHPVAYDKLAVRYRRWRNSLHSNDDTEKAQAAAALNQPLSAGELFAPEQEQAASN